MLTWYFYASRSGVEPWDNGHVIGRDFINLYTAGALLAEGNFAPLFSGSDYMAVIRGNWGDDYPVHNWSYPPTLFWPALFFSHFGYYVGLFAWYLLGILLIVLAVRALGLNPLWTVFIVLSPAGALNILAGQNGFIVGALIVFACVHLTRRPILAGLSWAILTMKPHLGIVALPLLFAGR